MARSRFNVRTLASMTHSEDEKIPRGYTLSPVRNSGCESTALLEIIDVEEYQYSQEVGKLKSAIHKKHRTLCSYHELPHWQKDNDYIKHGYVKETNNIHHCFDTLFFFNNETLNIFTHLIPGTLLPLALLLLLPYFLTHANFLHYIPPFLIHLPAYTTTDAYDNYIFGLFTLGFMTCLSCSAIFHMLKVHSQKIASMGSRLDYAGIILLIASSLIGIIHYSLIDHPIPKNCFIFITSTIGICALFCTWHPQFRSPEWRPIRTSTFVIFAFSGLIPIMYGFYIFEFHEAVNRAGLKFVLFEALSYLTGASIYAFRLPERWIPGKVDMVGNSHQIFHTLVVLGAWFHFKALVTSYHFAKSTILGGILL